MKLKKKHFFQLHSWIGTRLSILFFIVCFSGTLATLSNEMDWLFFPEIRAKPQTELINKNVIVENVREKYPNGKIQYWDLTEESYLCDIIYVGIDGKRTYVFANPYTGEIQGSTNLTFQRFFRDLHYYLFIPFQIGHFTVLIFGFLLLISLITALYFYKKWWRKLFELQTGKGRLVLFRSLHRLVGLWSIPFTILFSITGIWYFVERTNIGGISDEVNPSSPELTYNAEKQSQENISYTVDYARASAIAKKEIPGIKIGTLLPPTSLENPIYVTGKSDVPLVRKRANRVYLDPITYETVKVQKAEDISTAMWLNDIADPLHFGYWGGLITKFIWFIFGLGISGLILTGIWITLKRQAVKRKTKRKPVMGIWRYINWGIFIGFVAFMYTILITRYHISSQALITITFGWLVFLFIAYYIFHYRLKKSIWSKECK
ncbi:PepSY domain-containing protein [Salegentibacter sp. JZCK2]|uniref:PepSY-associated TM helix domain-containing protein n=1 Tax=Salegentibacter tibetensis TaxID=2873600 RepID=UPI001CC9EFEE|nr:PepSY-associated TM helix domain-containing protein [Salegentibacter tibetensis]MBZ9728762.1 PepSY domain-containing protein [Salegentibacter tibetensis]